MLDLLDLEDCKTLTNLPRNIGKLGSLKTLIISGCNIGELPIEMRNMKSLKVLNADRTTINPSHSSSGKVKWWSLIVCSMVSTPRKGPETLWAFVPFSLKELSLSGCNLFDDSFPENFSNLQSLGYLNLRNNPFQRLPNCFRDLSNLYNLDMSECHRLQTLDLNCLPKDFRFLEARYCRSLERITSLNGIASLRVVGCYKLVDIEDYLKKERTGKFNDIEISNYLGINKLMENHELDLAKGATFEFGIFSRYFGVGESPMFSQEKIKGSLLYFTVPSLSPQRIQCLNVFCTYGSPENDDAAVGAPRARIREGRGFYGLAVEIENKTKDHTWIYCPRLIHNANHENIVWLSKWRFGNQMEAGDEIVVTFDSNYGNYKVKECGFNFVYRDQEEENGTTTIEKSRHDFPAFRLSSGAYFLCQHFEDFIEEDYLPPKDNNIRC